jgi:hypothetical protein
MNANLPLLHARSRASDSARTGVTGSCCGIKFCSPVTGIGVGSSKELP